MDPKKAKELIRLHDELGRAYMDAAMTACEERDPFEVYRLVKESMSADTKARNLRRRYAQA